MDPNFERRHYSIVCTAHSSGAAPLADGSALDWFRRPTGHPSSQELNLRLKERLKERVRIARDLPDALFRGVLDAAMVPFRAAKAMSPDSPSKSALGSALLLMRRVIDRGRQVLDGLWSSAVPSKGFEEALTGLADELAAKGPRLRIWVMGRPEAFHPAIEKQVYLIAREAVVNALRHSAATSIETEVEYLPGAMRVAVRDNGLGIDQEVLQAERAAHWGLVGMRERAGKIGARLCIWSRKGAGTEVEISVPSIPVRGPLQRNGQPLAPTGR